MKIKMYVAYPAPQLGEAQPCAVCDGAGITGERYTMQTGERGLAVDVFCPACGGCGRAEHEGCDGAEHGILVENELDDDFDDDFDLFEDGEDPDDDQDDEPACPSCDGRTWFPVQGFTPPGENGAVLVLRVPCGCMEGRAEQIDQPGQ